MINAALNLAALALCVGIGILIGAVGAARIDRKAREHFAPCSQCGTVYGSICEHRTK